MLSSTLKRAGHSFLKVHILSWKFAFTVTYFYKNKMHKCLEDRGEENVIYKDQAYNRKNLLQNVISRIYDENNSFPRNYSIIWVKIFRNSKKKLFLLNIESK